MKNKLIKTAVILVLLAFLLIPAINPFLNDTAEAAAITQIQDTFGGLLGGTGMLTSARLICAAAVILVVWLACDLVIAALNWLVKKNNNSRSMVGLFVSMIKFLGFIIGGTWTLSVLGVNLTGIFASLGIASLIVGFGAQSLIEDAVTGIFIIFEGQYHVGDIIVLDGFRGTVKKIGVRTTCIEDAGGNQKIVNNSDIRNVQNRSRNTSVAVCDLSISYDSDIREVEKVIAATLPKLHAKYSKLFLTCPRYMGVESLGESSVVLRIVADVTEENFFLGYRTLNREMKLMCDQHGIEIPFNQIVVHQAQN